jgi:hypothetical protein
MFPIIDRFSNIACSILLRSTNKAVSLGGCIFSRTAAAAKANCVCRGAAASAATVLTPNRRSLPSASRTSDPCPSQLDDRPDGDYVTLTQIRDVKENVIAAVVRSDESEPLSSFHILILPCGTLTSRVSPFH